MWDGGLRGVLDVEVLLGPGGAGAAGAGGGPVEGVDVHAAAGHGGVPGVVDDEFGFGVGAEDDGVVAGANDFAGDGAEDAGAGFVAGVGVGAKGVGGGAVIDAVAFALVTAATIEAVVDAVALADARAFEGVPVEGFSIHGAVGLEELPIATGAQDGFLFAGEAGHVEEAIGDEGGAGTDFAGEIEEIAGVEKVPLSVVIAEGVGVDGEGAVVGFGKERAGAFVGAGGAIADGDAEGMFQAFGGEGVIEVETVFVNGDFRRPENGASGEIRHMERAAVEFPMDEVIGNEEGDGHFAAVDLVGGEVGFARGGGFGNGTGADGVVAAFVLPDERVGKVKRVNGIFPFHDKAILLL